MKPPPRLVDGADVRAQLLRAARHDAPGGRSRQRTTAAIALAVGSLTSRSTAALAAATVARLGTAEDVAGRRHGNARGGGRARCSGDKGRT